MSGWVDVIVRVLKNLPAFPNKPLGRFGAFAKAMYPLVGTLLAVGIQWWATGTYDTAELATTLTGVISAVMAFFASNEVAVIAAPLGPDGAPAAGAAHGRRVRRDRARDRAGSRG